MNPASRLLAGALALVAIQVLAADPSPLSTVSERSGFKKTGRYDEVIALCGAFAERYPDAVRCIDFGVTPPRYDLPPPAQGEHSDEIRAWLRA